MNELHRTVYAVCFKVLRHAQDAEDATQEALLEASRERQAVRDPARFDAWLHRVALHAALDVMRRRRTRERHEGRVAPSAGRAGDDRIESLYSALAGLPDDDRRVLVEHFIYEKTLREIARPEGCSEVAVWKRIGRAKRRLRDALALAGAGSALALLPREGFGTTAIPATLVKVGLAAAAAMIVASGVAVRTASRDEGPRPASPAVAAGDVRGIVESLTATAAVAKALPAVSKAPASRPPYPYRFPPPHWSPDLVATWQALRTKRMTIDMANEPLDKLLAEFTALSSVPINVAPGAPAQVVSFKIRDIVLDGALRLVLGPQQLAYELQEDGSIRVDAADRVTGRIAGEAQGIESVLNGLAGVRRRLDEGWDGFDSRDPEEEIEEKLKTTRWVSPQFSQSVDDRLAGLREAGKLNLMIDAGVGQEVMRKLGEPFAGLVEEGNLEYHLERICAEFGLNFWVTPDKVVLITTLDRAEESRKSQAIERAGWAKVRASLDLPLPEALPSSMPELAQALERALNLRVRVSEKVWESRTEFVLPAGLSAREALRYIAAQGGFRWAFDGWIYIVD